MLFSKTPPSKTTAFDTKLFAIKLEVFKATSMYIEHIILITNSLGFARKTVDPLVHSVQAYSLAVCSVLRLFFCNSQGYQIKFWDYPNMVEWSFYQMVHNNVAKTRWLKNLLQLFHYSKIPFSDS